MTSSPGFLVSLGISRNVEYHVIATPTPTSFQVSLTQAGPIQTFNNGTGINLQLAVITPANYANVTALNDDAALLTTFPRLYLDIHSELYKDIRRVNSINGSISDAKFALIHDKVQYDENLTPIWILYRSHGEQVMRFKRNSPLKIRFFSRDGNTLTFFDEADLTVPTNPYKQTIITVLETPYIRDAVYSNHATNPIS